MLQPKSSLFHRFMIGDIDVVQLSDGAVECGSPHAFFGSNASDEDFQTLAQTHGLSHSSFVFPATVTLVEARGERVLIDAGHGWRAGPNAGQLAHAMDQAGIEPTSIDHVILTHMHSDHIGGLLDADRRPIFSAARHWLSPLEGAYWLGPAAHQATARLARLVIEALGRRLSFISPGDELVEGVEIVDGAGHTPGQLCVSVHSKGEALMVVSDVATHPICSLRRPGWHMSLDVDPTMAARTRQRLLSKLAGSQTLMAGYHLPFPAVGRVQAAASDGEFVYTPASL